MALLRDLFNTVFRDYVTDGVPATGEHYPQKRDIRALGERIETLIGAAVAGLLYYSTRAQLNNDRSQKVGQLAFVYADPNSANNGVYHYESSGWVVDTAYAQGIVALAQAALNEALARAEASARMASLAVGSGSLTHDAGNARQSGRYTSSSAGQTMFNPETFAQSGLLGTGVVDQITSYFEQPVANCKFKILRERRGAVNSSGDAISGAIYYDFVAETATFNAVAGENVMNLDAATSLLVTSDCVLAIYTPAAGLSQAGNPGDPTGLDSSVSTPGTIASVIPGDFKGQNAGYNNGGWGYSSSVRMIKCRLRYDERLNTIQRLGSAYPEGATKLFGALGPDRMPSIINTPNDSWQYNPSSNRVWAVPVTIDGYLLSVAGYAVSAGRSTLMVFDDTGVVVYVENFTIAATGRFKQTLKRRFRMRPNYRAGLSQSNNPAKFGFLSDGSQISAPINPQGYPAFGTGPWGFGAFETASLAIQLEVAPLVETARTTPRTTLSLGDRYVRGADVLPVLTDTARIAGWGSSTMDYIAPDFTALGTSLGASYYNGGRGGEQMQDHLARLGSHPASLTGFQNPQTNTIRGSGSTPLAAYGAGTLPSRTDQNNLIGLTGSLLPFTGSIVLPGGALLAGTLQWNGAGYHEFIRRDAGADIVLPGGAVLPFIPDVGNQYRDALNLLNIGKNNINDGGNAATAADIIGRTHEAFDWLSPLIRRTLVINHFINTDTPAADPQYAKTVAVNAGLASRYGPLLLDLYGFVCKGIAMFGQTVWTASGVTPTSGDLAQQAAGTKPSSLSRDALHMNDAAEVAVAWLLRQKLLALGWY